MPKAVPPEIMYRLADDNGVVFATDVIGIIDGIYKIGDRWLGWVYAEYDDDYVFYMQGIFTEEEYQSLPDADQLLQQLLPEYGPSDMQALLSAAIEEVKKERHLAAVRALIEASPFLESSDD